MYFMKGKDLIFVIVVMLALVGCKQERGCTDYKALNFSYTALEEDGTCQYETHPDKYIFVNADQLLTVEYQDPIDLFNQLDEFASYMEGGAADTLSDLILDDMYNNTSGNGGGNFSFTSLNSLAEHTLTTEVVIMNAWLNVLKIASDSVAETASSGNAGTLTSDGGDTYLFADNGFDYAALIRVTLMGAVFIHQATTYGLGSTMENADNYVEVDPASGKYYTAMEHYWDQAFGYFGAPYDFKDDTTGMRYWALASNDVNGQINSNDLMMDPFINGRKFIGTNENYNRDQERLGVLYMWEKICGAKAMEHLEEAFGNVDLAIRNHEFTKGYAFIKCLEYFPTSTRVISSSQISNLLTDELVGPWVSTDVDISNSINTLGAIYGL